ncbi:MAG: T9SS type A sorting domain-containing protein [Chitinophagales bacterium]|nr:T9SS type A sorting domain-containing protein [Chitinophagales bacterium]
MKKIITVIMLIPIWVYSQCIGNLPDDPCCNQLIRIDPLDNNARLINTERNNLLNGHAVDFANFDINWLKQSSPHAGVPFDVVPSTGAATTVNNPIYIDWSEYKMITNFNSFQGTAIADLAMHPKHGWELMHAYNGYRPFTSQSSSPILMKNLNLGLQGYHYLFYNRYTGQARIFAYPATNQNFQAENVSVNIGFDINNKVPGQGNKFYTSGLFYQYPTNMLALDQPSDINLIKGFINPESNVDMSFPAVSDFKFAYDPCVCVNKPILSIELRNRQKMSLYAEGKFIAIAKQFDQSGKIPSSYGNTWMSSVYGDYITQQNSLNPNNFEVHGGFQTYGTAQQMADDYYVSPAMKILSQGLNLFGKLVDKIPAINIGTKTFQQFWGSIENVSGTASIASIYRDVEKSKYSIPVGNILAAGANKLSSMANSPAPNAMFIEGQVALRGLITNDATWGGFSKRKISHPGSLHSKTASFEMYPYYNEAPGIFAMLKTPKLYYKKSTYRVGGEYAPSNHELHIKIAEPLEYAINPAAEIITDKSMINGIIEFDFYIPKNIMKHTGACLIENLNKRYYEFDPDTIITKIFPKMRGFFAVEKRLIPRVAVENKVGNLGIVRTRSCGYGCWCTIENDQTRYPDSVYHYIIQTRQMSIDSIHQTPFGTNLNMIRIGPGAGSPSDVEMAITNEGTLYNEPSQEFIDRFFDFRLKFIADYDFKENFYHKPQALKELYQYKYNKVEDGKFGNTIPSRQRYRLYNFPDTIRLSSFNGTTIPSNISAEVIIIDVDINSPNTMLNLNFTDEVYQVPGTTVNAIYQTNKIIHPYTPVVISPKSADYLKSYCDNNYKAGNSLKSAQVFSTHNSPGVINSFHTTLTLHPNPSTSLTTLTIQNPSSEQASVRVYDLIGREVYSRDMKDVSESNNKLEISTDGWQTGLYIVKVIHGEVEKSIKLEVR